MKFLLAMKSYVFAILHAIKTKKYKEVWKTFGWKSVLIIFTYYFIRDFLIFVIIPYFLFNKNIHHAISQMQDFILTLI